jgi:hypothetical protein
MQIATLGEMNIAPVETLSVSFLDANEKTYLIPIDEKSNDLLREDLPDLFEVYEHDYIEGNHFSGIPYTLENVDAITASFHLLIESR